jgi:thiosulfate dehydrogenase
MKLYYSFMVFLISIFCSCSVDNEKPISQSKELKPFSVYDTISVWCAPDTAIIPNDEFGTMVRYGRDLIVNTAFYIGPDGIVSRNLGNKMNCTHCHLEAGTKPYALNYFSSHARYPQYRSRENKILTLADRINNCIERPHSGKPLKIDSKEMIAMVCYIKWLGQNVPINQHVEGDSPIKIELPERAADPIKGEQIYKRECLSCHGKEGEGKMRMDKVCYEYPPLWGPKSYQPGSSMHRVVKAATFIYANMPNKIASFKKPALSVEEAFDVAAFINDDAIHQRPINNGAINYPNNNTKPLDYGIGPFTDTFPAKQHKFGPWKPILEFRKLHKLPATF